MTNLQDNYAKSWTLSFKTREDYELFIENEALSKSFKVNEPIIRDDVVIVNISSEKRTWKSTL